MIHQHQSFSNIYVQVLLNSTAWELETHGSAYTEMKKKLGLDNEVIQVEKDNFIPEVKVH
jgi:hypothetical protein